MERTYENASHCGHGARRTFVSSARQADDGADPEVYLGECDNLGCLIYTCDEEDICVEDVFLAWSTLLDSLGVTDQTIAELAANAGNYGKTRPSNGNVALLDGIIQSLTRQPDKPQNAVFWHCGPNDKDLCCAGGRNGCMQMIATCNQHDNKLGFYDENAGVGTCYRE
jgi:hypothetical protein